MEIPAWLIGKNIGVLGYGPNHKSLVHWLLERGAAVRVLDKNAEVLRELPEKIGLHCEDILADLDQFDVVFRTPSIPSDHPQLKSFQGIVTSQTKLFFELCPCHIVGVTGTKGKGTTCSLIYELVKERFTTYLAGNIGLDPFSFLDQLTPTDLVILELSSFQLEDLDRSPETAVLLRTTLDHLDHHGTIDAYRAAKANILTHQSTDDVAIINVEDEEMLPFVELATSTVVPYSKASSLPPAWVEQREDLELVHIQAFDTSVTYNITERKLIGVHNRENIMAALLVATHFRIDPDDAAAAIAGFTGLPHRLQLVVEHKGIKFYDDSIATTPESGMVAVRAFPGQRVHLIAGGMTEGSDFHEFADVINEHCVSVSLLPGNGTDALAPLLVKPFLAEPPLFQSIFAQLDLHPGDIVLLAPGAKSFASFRSYVDRGEQYVNAIHEYFG